MLACSGIPGAAHPPQPRPTDRHPLALANQTAGCSRRVARRTAATPSSRLALVGFS